MSRNIPAWLVLAPLLYMLFLGGYFVVRFEGRWAEVDTTLFTSAIRNIMQSGHLVPASGEVYPGGYGYQSISFFLVRMTGLEVRQLQQLIYPLLASLVVLPAWLLYREVSGSARGATISAMLLFTQPEFLFVIIRGSHEKFTRTYMLLCLFLLFRSFKLRDTSRLFGLHVGLFYLLAFAFASTNNAMAVSFFVSIGTAMGMRWVQEKVWWLRTRLARWMRKTPPPDLGPLFSPDVQRLFYITLICIGLTYVVLLYIYPYGLSNVSFFTRLGQESVSVVTEGTTTKVNPYSYVKTSWTSLPFYLLVSSSNWILLGGAALIWLWKGVRWFWKGDTLQTESEWLPWLLFASLGVQAVGSVVADMGGGVGNIQVRLFPSISIMSVMLVGPALTRWRPVRLFRPVRLALTAAIALMAVMAGLKVTNEPMLSNKWMFYHQDEVTALEWCDTHLHYAHIWTEFDERLWVAFGMTQGESRRENRYLMNFLRPERVRNVLITDITRLRSSRMKIPLPLPPDSFRVYDNGEAQLYHLRPRTRHQQ
ncbi:MAG: hypothetical protein HC884_01135 [Chloroflexaceae bacterium]|nr:hypothetical protein [Chloroflexaceae bacterium]